MTRSTSRPGSTSENKVSRPETGRTAFERIVVAIVGLVLIAAGLLKILGSFASAPDEHLALIVFMAFAEAELLVGLWFLIDSRPGAMLTWALAVSTGLAAASLYQVLTGQCACNRFGDREISPWLSLAIDVVALAALMRVRGLRPIFDENRNRLALVIVAIIVGFFGAREAGSVSISGTASVGGHILDEAILTFVGNSGPISVRTTHDGHFRLPSVRQGLYLVSTPERPSAPPMGTVPPDRKASMLGGRQRSGASPPKIPAVPSTWIRIIGCNSNDIIIELK